MHPSITTPRTQAATHFASRPIRAILVAIGTGALEAACYATAPNGPRDVGNMAYPTQWPAGNEPMTFLK